MLKGENINGYIILEDFSVAGGRSKVSFAQKDGTTYFIKEFLAPKYPMPDSPGSERVKAQKKKICEMFEKHHKEIGKKIRNKVGIGSNLVFDIDFFRCGTTYYKVNEKIDTLSISCEDISKLPIKDIILIAKCVCHSINILHGVNIVHGDLKPDNILIKKTPTAYSAKVIDFDDSFFSQNPPVNKEETVGTPEYYSPEQAEYIKNEDAEGDILTLKSDVFTLGVIFCEYFTGEKPVLSDGCIYTWDYLKKGNKIKFAKPLPKDLHDLILSMLELTPQKRPSVQEVFNTLKSKECKIIEEPSRTVVEHSPELRGSLTGKGVADKTPAVSIITNKSKLRGTGLAITGKK